MSIWNKHSVKRQREAQKSETKFSREMRKELRRQCSILSIKTNDRVTSGIPDIYLAGGQWVESKVVPNLPSRRQYPLTQFTQLQRIFLDSFSTRGDRCYAMLLLVDDIGRWFTIMPWYYFRRIRRWDSHTLNHFAVPWDGAKRCDLSYFCWHKEGGFDEVEWKHKFFETWKHRNSLVVFDAGFKNESEFTDPQDKEDDDEEDSPPQGDTGPAGDGQ